MRIVISSDGESAEISFNPNPGRDTGPVRDSEKTLFVASRLIEKNDHYDFTPKKGEEEVYDEELVIRIPMDLNCYNNGCCTVAVERVKKSNNNTTTIL
jgi:hypothetical protein